MCDQQDNEEYVAKLTSCIMYVPIGIMSLTMANDLYAKWSTMPIKYHYQRLVCKAMTIPANKQEFYSDALFPESENPTRVYIVIVDSASLQGFN